MCGLCQGITACVGFVHVAVRIERKAFRPPFVMFDTSQSEFPFERAELQEGVEGKLCRDCRVQIHIVPFPCCHLVEDLVFHFEGSVLVALAHGDDQSDLRLA